MASSDARRTERDSEESPPSSAKRRASPGALRVLEPASRILAGLIILIVESAGDEGASLAGTLSSHGAYVLTARSTDQAMGVLSFVSPNILVCNMDLLPDHAAGLIGQVRTLARGGGIRALVVTARSGTGVRADESAAGFDEQVRAPVDVDRLLDAIERLIVLDTFRRKTHVALGGAGERAP